MNKIKLGKTGLLVNELGFGGIPLTRVEPDEAVKLVRHCYEQGVEFFDTAHMYGDSEAKLGQALEPVREKVILATKTMERGADGARAQMEQSLSLLRTDYLDLIQLHNLTEQEQIDTALAPGGALEAMRELQAQGKVRHIGFSSHNPDVAARLCRSGLFETVQIPFNFVESDPVERLFGAAREQNMGIIAMKPLGGGMLDRADLCFKFLRQFQDVLPIPGIETKAEIDEIIGFYEKPLQMNQTDLDGMERIKKELGPNFCHRCGYCMPCPEGVLIPRVLLFDSQAKRFPRETLLQLTTEAMASAQNCTECGQCLEKCPYSLPVPELVAQSFEHYQMFRDQAV